MTQDVVYPGKCSCALEKKVYSVFGWNVLKISMRSILSNVTFKTCVSLLNFCLYYLSIFVSGVLSLLLLFCYCQFLFSCLLVFVLCIEVLLCWVHQVSSVQFSSLAQLCPTLCNPMDRSTPGLPVHHHLPEFTTRVHQISDAIQPSHLLSSSSPPAPNPSQHQSLFQ